MPARPLLVRMLFVRLLTVSLPAVCLIASAGCDKLGGGGAAAVPTVKLRTVELDDEDVQTQPVGDSSSEMPVIAPSGEAIVPPAERTEPVEEPPAEDTE